MESSSFTSSSEVTPSSITASNCCEGELAGNCEYECDGFGNGVLVSGDCSTRYPPTPYPPDCDSDDESEECETCFCEEFDPPPCPTGKEGLGDTFFTSCWVPDAGGGTLCSDL